MLAICSAMMPRCAFITLMFAASCGIASSAALLSGNCGVLLFADVFLYSVKDTPVTGLFESLRSFVGDQQIKDRSECERAASEYFFKTRVDLGQDAA